MKFTNLLLATLILLVGRANKTFATTDIRVCTQTPEGIVNVRSGPGSNYSIVGEAYDGRHLHYSYGGGMSDDNSMPPRDQYGYYWVKVGFDRSTDVGFMRADFLGCSPSNLQQWFIKNLKTR